MDMLANCLYARRRHFGKCEEAHIPMPRRLILGETMTCSFMGAIGGLISEAPKYFECKSMRFF